MTTVVPTSEEDPTLAVVRFTAEMSWAEAGPEVGEAQVSSLCTEAQECMIGGRWFDLASLMLTSANLLFSKANDKDLECIFTVICNLVKKSESIEESLEIAKLLSDKIAQQPNEKPALRLKILLNLYNLLENSYGRFLVYMKALEVAANGKIEDDEVESWVVRAITAKLVDCRIDKMNQIVTVSRYTNRVFGPSQWLALRTNLTSWRGNIANVITAIQANKFTEEGTQSMQGLMIR